MSGLYSSVSGRGSKIWSKWMRHDGRTFPCIDGERVCVRLPTRAGSILELSNVIARTADWTLWQWAYHPELVPGVVQYRRRRSKGLKALQRIAAAPERVSEAGAERKPPLAARLTHTSSPAWDVLGSARAGASRQPRAGSRLRE